jgi:hypothetical protein
MLIDVQVGFTLTNRIKLGHSLACWTFPVLVTPRQSGDGLGVTDTDTDTDQPALCRRGGTRTAARRAALIARPAPQR